MRLLSFFYGILLTLALALLSACGGQGSTPAAAVESAVAPTSQKLVIYSARSESLVGPIVEQFQEATGVEVEVRWGNTAELAATLLEEGANSPADVFFAQDPGGLGAVADILAPLPEDILNRVDSRFRGPEGHWVGISGRARVIVYNTERLTNENLPEDIWDFRSPVERSNRLGAYQCLVSDDGDRIASHLGRGENPRVVGRYPGQ